MTNEELLNLIRTAPWFYNLGNAAPQPGIVVVNAEQWKQIFRSATQAEFNLPGVPDGLSDLPDFDWLTSSLEKVEMNLKETAKAQGKEDLCKFARLEAFKSGQSSLRQATEHPLLTVGAARLHEAARSAALLACRVAASEAALEEPGVGCKLISLYRQGQWPFALTDGDEIVVL